MNKLAKIDYKEFGLNETEAVKIKSGLSTILTEREVLIDAYKDVINVEITEETIPQFKALRLLIAKNRNQGLKVWHKTNKAYFLAGGNFVQAIYNKEVAENERMETALMDAEKHFERIEAERVVKLAEERNIFLHQFEPEMIIPNIGEMEESVWTNFITGIKLSFEQRQKEAEEAEKERLRLIEVEKENARLKAIEDEKIRAENARLKAEADAKELALKLEREKADDERKALEKIESDKRQKLEDSLKAERDKARIVAEKAAEAQAKLESDIKAKKDAEILEAKAQAKAAKMAAQAPDKDKLIKSISEMTFINAEFKTIEAIAVHNVINQRFEAFKVWAIKQTDSL